MRDGLLGPHSFPQPPLQRSGGVFQAAWCYFPIGVSVSSRILPWFVTHRRLGSVKHFNSETSAFSSESPFSGLPGLLPEEVNSLQPFSLLLFRGKHCKVSYSKTALCWRGLSTLLEIVVQVSPLYRAVRHRAAAWHLQGKRGPKGRSRRTHTECQWFSGVRINSHVHAQLSSNTWFKLNPIALVLRQRHLRW